MNSKHLKWLIGLVTLWTTVIVWQWFMESEPQRVPLTNVSGSRSLVKQATLSEWAVNQPKPTPESPAMPKRNLFAPLTERQEQLMLVAVKPRIRKEEHNEKSTDQKNMPAPTEAAAVSLEKPAAVQPIPAPMPPQLSTQELAEMAERQEREQRIGKLRAQAAQYRLIGLSEGGGVKQAFVEKGSDIYVVRQGDTLDDVFMVSIIDLGGVKIRDAEFNVEYTMPLKKDGG